MDEESQQASIPKDYGTAQGTVPATGSADAGGSARRVAIALAAKLLASSPRQATNLELRRQRRQIILERGR